MSWLARSLANSLRLEDDDDCVENDVAPASPDDHGPSPSKRSGEDTQLLRQDTQQENSTNEEGQEEEQEAQGRGVKEDLTELRQTLTQRLWGVASFLAPPPTDQSELSDRSAPRDIGPASDSEEMLAIGHDFAKIGGSFMGEGTEISKMASNYLPFGSEENERESEELESEEFDDWRAGAIGITDEVLAFARNIAMHPETWLDFPLEEEEDLDDFDMSDAQRQHALVIEQLAPRLAALRIELCPCHMTESYFRKVYFVLLHSRLNKYDAELLSTPQVMEARAMWMQELHKLTKPESDWSGRNNSSAKGGDDVKHEVFGYGRAFDFGGTTSTTIDYKTEKHPVASTEVQFIDKSVIEEKPIMKAEDKNPVVGRSSKTMLPNYEDDEDDWLEEDSDLGGYKTTFPTGNEEDISFSDLEDDASTTIPITPKKLTKSTKI
uniref:BSD domain-containing protein n=1 Tax=Rhizophora mucronata TaxID=61149 RepID=A0A2P2MZY0_RHIMU